MREGNPPTLAKGWQWRKFGDCAQFINGRAYAQEELLDAGTPVLRIQNLNGGDRWYYSNLKLPDEKYCEAGDLLYAWSASFGPYRFTGPKSIFHYHIWRVIPGAELDKTFAFHLLEEITAEVKTAAHGVAMLHMTKGGIEAWSIPLPPLAEQRRIAEILDKADALRAKRRAALAQFDSLTHSIFLDMFGDPATNPKGWPRFEFSELLANIDSGWSPKCLDRPVMGKEWGILKLGAVTWCEYDATENKALPPDVEPDAGIEVKRGDLLFARKNTYELVAACALVRETPPRLLMSDLIFRLRLRPDVKVDSTFLHQLLIYPTKRREIQKLAGGSAGSMPNISKARLETISIEVPPIELQREFARRVTAVEKLKTAHRAFLTELDALFATLQHRAFRGEL